MSQVQKDSIIRIVKLLNLVVMTAIFAVIWLHYYGKNLYFQGFYRRGNWLFISLFVFLYYFFGRTYDAFQLSYHRISEMVYSQSLALCMTDFVMMVVTWLLMRKLPSFYPILLIFILQLIVSAVWSTFAHRWYFHTFHAKKTMIIYDMREGMEDLISQYGMESKFAVDQILQINEVMEKGHEILEGYEAVYLCGIHSKQRNIILKYCVDKGITVFVIPRIGDVLMSSAKRMHMFHLPVLRIDRYKPVPEYVFIKRFLDIIVSGIALVLLSPLMLIVVIAVKSDGGPALYKQVRLTKDGKEFKVLKFRSMRVDAEKDGVARLSSGENDDRITKVGRIIRACRADELPQLWNIFVGEMSIVGPRPERPEIARQYEEELPEFKLRLQAKAGLTGYAQVYGKYNTSPYDKLMMDLMYIAHPSVVEDLRIIMATVKILFSPESTEGIAKGNTIAGDSQRSL